MISIICAIIKNEHQFIREWVDHYINIGFNKLYIFEDFDSDSHYEILKDFISDEKVELTQIKDIDDISRNQKGTQTQYQLYNWFLNKCKIEKIADWVGFFDVDEFMMFEEGYNLEKLESEFNDTGGILLSWLCYGANGHIKHPEGSVVDNYKTPTYNIMIKNTTPYNVKSFVNVHNSSRTKTSIHIFDGCVFTDRIDHIKSNDLVYKKAWLNHYYTKSWEDYLKRIFSRGNMNNNYRCLDEFFKCSPEFMNNKTQMCEEQRYNHTKGTMWISRSLRIISGGNKHRLNEITQKINSKK